MIAGFPVEHKVLTKQEFDDWKKTIIWEWDRDEQGRALDTAGNPLFGPDFKGDPGHPNILTYSERPLETECQLCRIIREKGHPPVPKILLVNELPKPEELRPSDDPDGPGTLILHRMDSEKRNKNV